MPPPLPRPGLAHTAHTVLGLAAAARGDLDGAAVHLRDSLGADTDASLTTQLPNLMLAEALLAAGRTAPVVAYLDVAAKIPWYRPEFGRLLAGFQSQYQAGNLRSFGAVGATLH
ncbi:MAG: hypothetical protein NTZ56_00460 [Acidobacteria bacterium]|nr:hypothetical protein [Acidobacteriota bacterium]